MFLNKLLTTLFMVVVIYPEFSLMFPFFFFRYLK